MRPSITPKQPVGTGSWAGRSVPLIARPRTPDKAGSKPSWARVKIVAQAKPLSRRSTEQRIEVDEIGRFCRDADVQVVIRWQSAAAAMPPCPPDIDASA